MLYIFLPPASAKFSVCLLPFARRGNLVELNLALPLRSQSATNELVRALVTAFLSLVFWSSASAYAADWNGVIDLSGKPVDPFAPRPAKAAVFVFVKTDCPISNRYAPEVKRLYSQFSRKGVLFWLVYPDSNLSLDAIRKHVKEYDYPCAALQDLQHRLVEVCKAQVTPEAAVFTADRQLIYHGRIDDRYVAFGKSRPAPARRDLQEVLTALLDGRPIPSSQPAIGCLISSAK